MGGDRGRAGNLRDVVALKEVTLDLCHQFSISIGSELLNELVLDNKGLRTSTRHYRYYGTEDGFWGWSDFQSCLLGSTKACSCHKRWLREKPVIQKVHCRRRAVEVFLGSVLFKRAIDSEWQITWVSLATEVDHRGVLRLRQRHLSLFSLSSV